MSLKIRIIVAEAREVFRKSLVAFLQTNPEFHVVTDAANGRELLEYLKQNDVDVILLDTDMPIMDGKSALEIIQRRFPDVRIIILSDKSNAQLQSDFMSYGANSFLGKNCESKTLFKAIYKVKSEGYFFDNSTSKALLEAVLKDKHKPVLSSESNLNEKETEILIRICDGKTNKEIAQNLHLSPSTIDFHRTKIYQKIKCNNVTGLLKYALKNGLIALS